MLCAYDVCGMRMRYAYAYAYERFRSATEEALMLCAYAGCGMRMRGGVCTDAAGSDALLSHAPQSK